MSHSMFENLVIAPSPEGFPLEPLGTFRPTVHKISHEVALEEIAQLADQKFMTHAGAEIHSGIHPHHGKCIISIYNDGATLIPFL